MASSHRPSVSTLRPRVGFLRVGTLRPRDSSLNPRVSTLRPLPHKISVLWLAPSFKTLASLELSIVETQYREKDSSLDKSGQDILTNR